MKSEREVIDAPSLGYAPTPPWDRVSVSRSEDGIEITVRPAPFLRECVPWFLIQIPGAVTIGWIVFLLMSMRGRFLASSGVDILDGLPTGRYVLWGMLFLLFLVGFPFVMTRMFHGERRLRFDRTTFSTTQPGVLERLLRPKTMSLEEIERFELFLLGGAMRAIGPRDGKLGGFMPRKLNALLVDELNRCLAEMKGPRT